MGPILPPLRLCLSARGTGCEQNATSAPIWCQRCSDGARPFVARTQHQYGRMLLARDGPGDREKALGLLTQALGTAKELGMERLAGRAETLPNRL